MILANRLPPHESHHTSTAIGVKTVIGDHSELDKITELAAQADIVLNAADADDLPLTKAVLNGLQKRSASSGLKPILVHTSGTGVAADRAQGEYSEEKPLYNASNIRLLFLPYTTLMTPSG
jgi:hypothetical protein